MALVELLPKPTWGISPSVEISVLKGFDLRASFYASGSTTSKVGRGTADSQFFGGALDACGVLGLLDDAIRLRGCAGVLAGGVNAAGSGFDVPETIVGAWVAPKARIDGRWSPIKHFGIVLGIEGFFPVVRPQLRAESNGVAENPHVDLPGAGAGFSLGPSIAF
jgi:hypothetical protein